MQTAKPSQDQGSRKIALLGNFGPKNLGNEATLQAIAANLRARMPEAEFVCICTDPIAAAAIHGIPTVPIHPLFVRPALLQSNFFTRFLRKAAIGFPNEIRRWLLAWRALRRTDMLIIPGTQFLSDNISGPWGWPYWAFRWCVAARLRGCRILFVSVGVGPLYHPMSRFLVRSALRLASFRSYRDESSRRYLAGIAFDCAADPVYPDLVFSLPPSVLPQIRTGQHSRMTIAVGVKDYHGQYGDPRANLPRERIYQRYLDQLATFLQWLVERGHTVRLVIGDVTYDTPVVNDVLGVLKERRMNPDGDRLLAEPIESIDELLRQLADSDVVISPRFHNIVLALMLHRPVLAISYHEKFAALLETPELARLNVAIDDADPEAVISKLDELEARRAALQVEIARNTAQYADALRQQYDRILELLPPR